MSETTEARMQRKPVPASRLHRVAPAYPWAMPPAWGSRVRLNAGSPEMLILDTPRRGSRVVMVGWPDMRGNPVEAEIDYRCLRPV